MVDGEPAPDLTDEEYDENGEFIGDLPPGYLKNAEQLAAMSIENGLSATCLYLDGVVLDRGSIDGESDPWREIHHDDDRAHAALEFVASTWSGVADHPFCPLDEGLGMPPLTIELARDLWETVGSEVLGVVWAPCSDHLNEAEVYLGDQPWHWRNDQWTPAKTSITD